jgi:hypothetical protein
MKNSTKILLFVALIVLLSSCAHIVPVQECVEGTKVYGFWNGLWHGMIAGITFIGSLFNHDIAVYAVNNNGGWYNFGFLLGVGAWSGSSTTYTVRKNRRR